MVMFSRRRARLGRQLAVSGRCVGVLTSPPAPPRGADALRLGRGISDPDHV